MAVTNLLKTQIDQPVYEWCRFAPFTSSALSCFTSNPKGTDRYIYAIAGTAFWRYDTISDSWQELGGPQIAGSTVSAMTYDPDGGVIAEPISSTSNTITVGGILSNSLVGMTIRIVSGTGAGQVRTITSVADPVVASTFVASAGTTSSVTDATRKWLPNQWKNYSMRVNFGTASGGVRRILYNDPTVLYFADGNLMPFNNWNVPLVTAPTALGSAGTVESVTLTVDTPWDTLPDSNSRFQIVGGVIWLVSSAGSASGVWIQAYDIITDTWYTKSSIGHSFNGSYATDFAIDHMFESAGTWEANSPVTSATYRSLTNSAATMAVDTYANFAVKILSGPGAGQVRRIVANTATTLWICREWDVLPTTSSVFSIVPDYDKIWMIGGGNAYMWQYSIEADMWATGPMSEFGVARNAIAYPVYTPPTGAVNILPKYGVNSITRRTNAVTAISIVAAGTGYLVGDLITITNGGGATAFVTGINASTGAVTSIQLGDMGTGTATAGTQTTTGGTGSGLTVSNTLGNCGTVALAHNHNFTNGQQVTMIGFTTSDSWNSTFTITCSNSSTFTIINNTATANAVYANSHTTTNLIDVAFVLSSGLTYFAQWRMMNIISNGVNPSAIGSRDPYLAANPGTTTVTWTFLIAAGTPVNGLSRYILIDPRSFGTVVVNQPSSGKDSIGWVDSATSTTLVDSTKSWNRSQWLNCRLRITSGNAVGSYSILSTNVDGSTLSIGGWQGPIPDSTCKYEIMDVFGRGGAGGVAGTYQNTNTVLPVNALAGKRIKFLGGTGLYGTDYSITSNTTTTLTTSGGQATDSSTFYCVFDVPAKATGIIIHWLYGLTDTTKRCRKMIVFRGGASSLYDIYDITTNRWELAPAMVPTLGTTFTGGSMSCYDGGDNLYLTKEATGRVYRLNLADRSMVACTTTPYAHGTAVIGNRMEIIRTADNLRYLYIMRHSGSEMWRTLVFW